MTGKKPRGMLPIPSRRKAKADLRLHEIIEVGIDDLANSGDGVGRLEGRVVFVPGTAPGDTARVRIVKAKKQWMKAQLVEVVTPGPERVEAPCEYAGRCGGCDWQHIDYAAQLAAKQQQLADTLARIGGLEAQPIEPIVACDPPLHYRNRVQGDVSDGALHFHQRGSGEAVAIARCLIADERINAFINDGLAEEAPGRVEIAVHEGEVQVSPIDDERTTERGFRQVNDAMGQVLEAMVLTAIEGSDAAHVLDLYCGAGAWTCRIAAAHPTRQVTGVELHAGNIREAEAARRAAGLKNVSFRAGRVEKLIDGLPLASSVCIVDPPRSGLEAGAIQALLSSPAARLVYVSCHPATLARDIKALERGYSVERVQPLDMFPQTAHLECCVTLVPR